MSNQDKDIAKHEVLHMETLMAAQIETLYREIVVLKELLREAKPYTLGAACDLHRRIHKVLGER